MDVGGLSSTFAPAASDAFLLVLVPDPVQPQQSQTSLSSQAATLPSSSALSHSTSSSCDTSPIYSHVLQFPPTLIESPTPPSSTSSSASSKRISRGRPNFRVDPLLRVANGPVMPRPTKVVSFC